MGLTCLSIERSTPSAWGRAAPDGQGHLAGLPVDDAGDDERQAAAAVHLVPELARVNLPQAAVEDVSRQGVQLLDLQQAAADSPSKVRLGHVLQGELGLEDSAELASSLVKSVLRGVLGNAPDVESVAARANETRENPVVPPGLNLVVPLVLDALDARTEPAPEHREGAVPEEGKPALEPHVFPQDKAGDGKGKKCPRRFH
jgi:hypothetical protein